MGVGARISLAGGVTACVELWNRYRRENDADESYMYTSPMLESHFAASRCCFAGSKSAKT